MPGSGPSDGCRFRLLPARTLFAAAAGQAFDDVRDGRRDAPRGLGDSIHQIARARAAAALAAAALRAAALRAATALVAALRGSLLRRAALRGSLARAASDGSAAA